MAVVVLGDFGIGQDGKQDLNQFLNRRHRVAPGWAGFSVKETNLASEYGSDITNRATGCRSKRRRAEKTTLHKVVSENLETWLE